MTRRQTAQTRAARGQPCTLRFFGGACQGDVVACHVKPRGFGTVGAKPDDLFTVFGCQRCHDVLDRRGSEWLEFPPDLRWETAFRALIETLKIKMDLGIVERRT